MVKLYFRFTLEGSTEPPEPRAHLDPPQVFTHDKHKTTKNSNCNAQGRFFDTWLSFTKGEALNTSSHLK